MNFFETQSEFNRYQNIIKVLCVCVVVDLTIIGDVS